MAAVFNVIEITYKGKTHAVKPTFEHINRIESSKSSGGLGISLAWLVAQIGAGAPPLSIIATVLAFFLRTTGIEVSDEDLYAEMVFSSDGLMGKYANAISAAVFPVSNAADSSEKGKKK